jgi:Flp pilus assembly protein TadD
MRFKVYRKRAYLPGRENTAEQDQVTELGTVYVYEGQYANAITHPQRAIRLKPDNGEAY